VPLIAKSTKAGNPYYLAAVRLFVAEEQNHADDVPAHGGTGLLRQAGTPARRRGLR
jgi:hypothetical protein